MKPLVYISVHGGIADWSVETDDAVEVVRIDWDYVEESVDAAIDAWVSARAIRHRFPEVYEEAKEAIREHAFHRRAIRKSDEIERRERIEAARRVLREEGELDG